MWEADHSRTAESCKNGRLFVSGALIYENTEKPKGLSGAR